MNVKKILIIVLAVALFFVSMDLFIDKVLIRSGVAMAVNGVVGAPVTLGDFSLAFFRGKIALRDLKIYNPKGFPNAVLLDMPEIIVEYSLDSLVKGEPHFPSAVIRLKEVVIIKNKDGLLNVDSLKFSQEDATAKKEGKQPPKETPLRIDVITLDMGRVVYKDYSQGTEEPLVKIYDINIKKTYRNIKSAQQLMALIMVESLKPAAIKGAKVYGAATVLGVGFLPAGIAVALAGKDNSAGEFNASFDQAHKVSVDTLGKIGLVIQENKSAGLIKAKVSGADITVRITKKSGGLTGIKVTARKYMLPQPNVAAGILEQIGEKLK